MSIDPQEFREYNKRWTAIGETLDEPAMQLVKAGWEALNDHHPVSGQHVERVAVDTSNLASAMGFSEPAAKAVYAATLWHDAGKKLIDPELLSKAGKPTPEEKRTFESHAQAGASIIASRAGLPNAFLNMAIEGALSHQEQFDGSGYPRGLKGRDIPLLGRMQKPTDTFDAIAHRGGYQEALGEQATLTMMQDPANPRMSGQFDPDILKIYVKMHQPPASAKPVLTPQNKP